MVPEKHPANNPEIEERTLVLSRVFDAPRALVFKVWTQPEHLARWWGPRGYTLISYKADVCAGGSFRFGTRSPENTEHWAHGRYREVTPPERPSSTLFPLPPALCGEVPRAEDVFARLPILSERRASARTT